MIYVFSYAESEFGHKNYLSCFDCFMKFKFKYIILIAIIDIKIFVKYKYANNYIQNYYCIDEEDFYWKEFEVDCISISIFYYNTIVDIGYRIGYNIIS